LLSSKKYLIVSDIFLYEYSVYKFNKKQV
jgi:hypothetical protein